MNHARLAFSSQEAFHSFHPEVQRVQKYLKPYYIGDLNNNDATDDEDSALKTEFDQLRQKVLAEVNTFDRT
jgi:hypothetical protein